MDQDYIIVTGAPVPEDLKDHGAVPVRREIRDLKQNAPKQWYLYIQALTALQNVPEGDERSYFQIAGESIR